MLAQGCGCCCVAVILGRVLCTEMTGPTSAMVAGIVAVADTVGLHDKLVDADQGFQTAFSVRYLFLLHCVSKATTCRRC